MRKIGSVVAILCGLGIASGSAVAENNSSLTPLTPPLAPKLDRTIGVCHLVNSLGVADRDDPLSPVYVISPAETVSAYFGMLEKRDVGLEGKITLLQGPEHGVLKEEGGKDYRYTPVPNYIGPDRATFIIEIGDFKVKAIYHFKAIDGGAIGGTEIQDKKNCPRWWIWKISTTNDVNGNLTVSSVEYQPSTVSVGASVGRNNQRALRSMNLTHPVQCAALIAPYSVAGRFFLG